VDISGQQKEEIDSYISIGLLVDKSNETEASLAARNAIEKINHKGGIRGKELKLVIRSVEGTWGAGSGKIVDLVFKDKVIAIVGSLDARNTHLAEQVIAKTQVPFLSAWASDPSLSNAYVSWFFTIVPNDEQQAEMLLNQICIERNIQDLLVVFDSSYDGEQAYKSLHKKAQQFPELKIYPIQVNTASDVLNVAVKLKENKIEGILLLGRELPVDLIQKQILTTASSIPVFSNLAVYGSNSFLDTENVNMSFANSRINNKEAAEQEYFKKKNSKGSLVGALTFDAVMALSTAIELSTGGQDDLKRGLSQLNYQGITGLIEFDALGRIKTSE